MSKTRNAHEGVVTTVADDDLVMVVGPNGGLHPISFANLMKAVKGGIQIGGRNLLKNSSVAKSASYYLGSYDLSEPWEIGQTYVMTIYGNLGNDAGPCFRVWDGRGFATIITCSKVSDGIYRGFFSPVTMQREYTEQERSVLKIYTSSNQAVSKSSISKVMFERGNIATDYTPAPEDIASGLWGGVIGLLPITYDFIAEESEKGGAHADERTLGCTEISTDGFLAFGSLDSLSQFIGRTCEDWKEQTSGIYVHDRISGCSRIQCRKLRYESYMAHLYQKILRYLGYIISFCHGQCGHFRKNSGYQSIRGILCYGHGKNKQYPYKGETVSITTGGGTSDMGEYVAIVQARKEVAV